MWAVFLAPICLCHAKKDFGSLDRESLDRELAQLFFSQNTSNGGYFCVDKKYSSQCIDTSG